MYDQTLRNNYDEKIQQEIESAYSLIQYNYDLYKKGAISEDEAKSRVKGQIKALRYGTEGYFWIDDINYDFIAHPVQPQNEEKNRKDVKNPSGNLQTLLLNL